MRTPLPWAVLEQAILLGPEPTSTERAKDAGAAAFDRLADMATTYRPLRKWLREWYCPFLTCAQYDEFQQPTFLLK